MATTTTTYNNNNNSAHKQFETGHADQIHDCQYDYYGRVRFFFRFRSGFFLLFVRFVFSRQERLSVFECLFQRYQKERETLTFSVLFHD